MSWRDIVKSVAPMLGTALGGPFGGMATKFLAGKLLGDENAGEEQIQDLIAAQDPEVMLKLKEADQDFKVRMRELGLDEKKIAAQDRDSARRLGAQTTLIPQMTLSTIFVTAFTVILYAVFTRVVALDGVQQNIVMYLLGILSAGMVQIMNFWFGSSSGSKEKDALNLSKAN